MPATSSNVTPVLRSTYTLALLLPMAMSPCCGPKRRMSRAQTPTNTTAGSTQERSVESQVFSTRPVNLTFAPSSSATSPGSSMRAVTKRWVP